MRSFCRFALWYAVFALAASGARASGSAASSANLAAPSGLPQTASQPVAATPAKPVSGYSLLHAGRYLEAITAFEQTEPKTPVLYNQLGIAAEHMYMDAKARDSYERAIGLDPHYSEAYNNLGTLYYGEKNYGKAEKYYKRALRLNPSNAFAEDNLGTLYFSRRKFHKGELAYRRALALDKDIFEKSAVNAILTADDAKNKAEAHFHLARLFAQEDMDAAALDSLQKAIGEGFRDRKRLLKDEAFAELRTQPGFMKLVNEIGS